MATLTKGPQAPLYFVGAVSFYCLITGRRRQLFSRDHAIGLLTGLGIVGLWQVPYAIKMGPEASVKIYFHDVGPRFFDFSVGNVTEHMLTYPLELLGGALLPWSAWLICLLSEDFRKHLRRWRDDVLFLVVCMAVAFPSVWIAPGASLRYYMSLFPCFACLVGILVEVSRHLAGTRWMGRVPVLVSAGARDLDSSGRRRCRRHFAPGSAPMPEYAQSSGSLCFISRLASWPPAGSGGFRRS